MVNLGPLEPMDAKEIAEFRRAWAQAARDTRHQIIRSSGVSVASATLGYAYLTAAVGPCQHPAALAVHSVAGEKVAALCPDCDTQLPAQWETVD